MYALQVKIPGTKRDAVFTYHHREPVPIGAFAVVSFRGKNTKSLVVDCRHIHEVKMDIKSASYKLRPIESISGAIPLPPQYFDSVDFISKFYSENKVILYDTLIPRVLYESAKVRAPEKHGTQSQKYFFQDTISNRIDKYKSLIRESFAKKESIIIVVPRGVDATTLRDKLEAGIKKYVYTLSSDETKKNLKRSVDEVVESTHPLLVICTPIFVPLVPNAGTIILESESSQAYYQEPDRVIDQRVYIESYATLSLKRFILADSIVRGETYARYSLDEIKCLNPKIVSLENFVQCKIIDAKSTKKDIKQDDWVSITDIAVHLIEKLVEQKKRVLLFSLKKGLATQIACHHCEHVLCCGNCGSPYILRERNGAREFFCVKCKDAKGSNIKCPACESWDLRSYGIGVDRVYKDVKKLFPETDIIFIDKPAARQPRAKAGSITIAGTEIFDQENPEYDACFVVSMDSLLSLPLYNNGEKVLDLLTKIQTLSKNPLYVQTRLTDHPIITLITSGRKIEEWYKRETEDRLKYQYPPFYRIVSIEVSGAAGKVNDFKRSIEADFSDYHFATTVRKKTEMHYELTAVIKVANHAWPKYNSLRAKFDERLIEKFLKYKDSGCDIFVDK